MALKDILTKQRAELVASRQVEINSAISAKQPAIAASVKEINDAKSNYVLARNKKLQEDTAAVKAQYDESVRVLQDEYNKDIAAKTSECDIRVSEIKATMEAEATALVSKQYDDAIAAIDAQLAGN